MEPGGGRGKAPHTLCLERYVFYIEKSSHIRKKPLNLGLFPGSFFDFAILFETSNNFPPSSQEKNLGRVELERY